MKRLFPFARKLISRNPTVQDEEEMVNEYAVKMRRKYPALGKAWKHYKTVWHLILGEK